MIGCNMYMNKIREELYKLADEKYKGFSSRLIPGKDNILGVRLDLLRKIAKKEAKNNAKDFLQNIGNKYFEEVMLKGMVIAFSNISFDKKLVYIEKFIPEIDNWSVCDSFCSALKKDIENNKENMFKFISKYFSSQKEFEVRFAYVTLLRYYVNDNYIDRVFDCADLLISDAYYAKMSLAWLLAETAAKYENKTKKYIKTCKLDKFTVNKAIQKVCESKKVSESFKENLKKLRR